MKKNNKIISSLILISILIFGAILPIINAETPESTIRSNNHENNIDSINLTDGLVGYWSFNNQSNVAYDDSGNNNNGINHGANYLNNGIVSGSLDFEYSQNDFIEFSSKVLDTPPYSICAWVKPESIPVNENTYIISNGGESISSHGFYLYYGNHEDPNFPDLRWQFGVKSSENKGCAVRTKVTSLNWTFICGTWDGSLENNSVKLYINGFLRTNGTPTYSIIGNSRDLRIGKVSKDSLPYYFDGIIDEVRIYNRVLSDDEILNLYRGYISINQSNYSRGFPIRHAIDGDWGASQSFKPLTNIFTGIEIYIQKFGNPEFDFKVELRESAIEGTLIESIILDANQIPEDKSWFFINFEPVNLDPFLDYYIVCPSDSSNVNTSFGYEWGYSFGNQYDNGAFWFTRDGGGLWRSLPSAYDFSFRTFGY